MANEGPLDRKLNIEYSRKALKTVVADIIRNFKIQMVLDENEVPFTNNILRPWHAKKTGNESDGNATYIAAEIVSLIHACFAVSKESSSKLKDMYIRDLEIFCRSKTNFQFLLGALKKACFDYIEMADLDEMTKFSIELTNIVYENLETPASQRLSLAESRMLYDDHYDFLNPDGLPGNKQFLIDEMYRLRNRLLIDANTDLSDPEIDAVCDEANEIIEFVKRRLEELGIK
jgi:hypothetical protein